MPVATDIPLAPLCTLGTGGAAERFLRINDEAALRETGAQVTILGGGSNVVIGDQGVRGLVAQMCIGGVSRRLEDGAYVYRVGAGVSWDAFVQETLCDGASGLEVLSGIPGTVGATPMQNVGAYGREVGEFLRAVRLYDRRDGSIAWYPASALGLGYRRSDLKGRDRYIVCAVEMALLRDPLSAPIRYGELGKALAAREGMQVPVLQVRDTVLSLRRCKGMLLDAQDPDSRSVGSFFTNPIVSKELAATLDARVPRYPQVDGRVKLAAGWLVENAGGKKGLRLGAARISDKHALALVNAGNAKSEDILALARHVRALVHEKFAVWLEAEPVLIGCSL